MSEIGKNIPELLFSIIKRVGHKINWLKFGDWVFLNAGLFWIEWQSLAFITFNAILQKTYISNLYLPSICSFAI